MKRSWILFVLCAALAVCLGGAAVYAAYQQGIKSRQNSISVGNVVMELVGENSQGEPVEEGAAYFGATLSPYNGAFTPADYNEAMQVYAQDNGASVASAVVELRRHYDGEVFYSLSFDHTNYENNVQLYDYIYVSGFAAEGESYIPVITHLPFAQATKSVEDKLAAGETATYRLFFTAESAALSGEQLQFDLLVQSRKEMPVTAAIAAEGKILQLTALQGGSGFADVSLDLWYDGTGSWSLTQGDMLFQSETCGKWVHTDLIDVEFVDGQAQIALTGEGALFARDVRLGEFAVVDALPNADFETGDLTGWTVVEGNADLQRVISDTSYWENDVKFHDAQGITVQRYLQQGDYFLYTDEGTTTVIRSESFKIDGDGILSFKLGAAREAVNYVALCDANTGEELIRLDNTAYFNDPLLSNVMLRRFMYAQEYIGRDVYFKLVDGATSGFGFITFDDLQINLTYDEACALADAEKQQMATYRDDVLASEDHLLGSQAKEVVRAVRSYYADLRVEDFRTVVITQPVRGKCVAAGEYDLTSYLQEAEGVFKGAPVTEKQIVGVNDGSQTFDSGFGAMTLAADKQYTVTYRLKSGEHYAEAKFVIDVINEHEILNGGFETGDLSGWTAEGGGFAAVESATACYNGSYNQAGEYHLNGWEGADGEAGTGKLRSSVFTLGGNRMLSFRLGGGNNRDGIYISVKREDGTEIARFTNTKQERYKDDSGNVIGVGEQYMWLYVFDLTQVASLGDRLYIEIVDSVSTDWGLVFVDDIQTYHTTQSLASLGEKNKDYFEAENML